MKKTIKLIILILFILVVLGTSGYFVYSKIEERNEEKHIEEVKNLFSESAKIKKDTDLYKLKDDAFIKDGKIFKDTHISLEKINKDYYKIKDTDYYVFYQDITAGEELEVNISKPYLLWNENVITKNPVDLYKNEKHLVTLNSSLTFPVLIKGDNYYSVMLENEVFQIPKEQIEETIETENNTQESLEKISIFYITETKNIEEKIKYLTEQKYTFITEEELELFLKGNIRLPKNTTMLIFKEKSEEIENLILTYSLTANYEENLTHKYTTADSQTSSLEKLNQYKVTSSTKISRFKDMLQGKKEVVITTPQTTTSSSSSQVQKIPVLNYHFFYDKNTQICNESICLDQSNFEAQLKYLKDNGFKTLTMQEFNDWLDKKIELPKKSVLITIDDGAMGTDTILPDMLDKYDAKATLFLISGWWPMSKYRTGNLEIQSHGHDIHHNNFCLNGNCGKKGLILSKEELIKDFRLSKQTIGNSIAFCYPFYAYNNTLTSAVQEEFSLAFIGGNKKAARNVDKYKIPRYIIYKNTSLESFKQMVN